jgi:hypothetical protein
VEGVNWSMIYLIHCKKFCKCHNVPPLHNKKIFLKLFQMWGVGDKGQCWRGWMQPWNICNIVSFKNLQLFFYCCQCNNKSLLKLKRKNFGFLSDASQLHQGYQKWKASTINFISEIFCSHCQDDMQQMSMWKMACIW